MEDDHGLVSQGMMSPVPALPPVGDTMNSNTGKHINHHYSNTLCLVTPGQHDDDVKTGQSPSTHLDDGQAPGQQLGGDEEQSEEDISATPPAARARRRGRTTRQRPCVYDDEGVCEEHGPGAVRYWRPVRRTERGPDGIERVVRGREYYFE